jgi:hypothetical protein
VRPVVRWLVPDVGLVAATVTLFYCLFFFQGYEKLFRDSDAGWHIRNGESILRTGTLPRTDPWSFTRPGQPWVAWEWAADLVTGAIHRSAGLRGVALIDGAVIAAGVWIWFRIHWAVGGEFLIACAMLPPMLSTSNIHWMARPHTIGWLFLLVAVLWAETARRFAWVEGVLLAVFMALWANLHASFFFGITIALLYAAVRRLTWTAVAICALAPLGNPYGWRLYEHVFRYLTNSELLSRISEFQSFDYQMPGTGQIVLTMILGIAGGTLAFTQRRWERFALAMLLSVTALRSARGLPLVALVLLPLANAGISDWLRKSGVGMPMPRLREIDRKFNGLALTPLPLLLAWAALRFVPVGFPRDQFPVDAYPHIPAEARLFAPDKFGGYLIYRSNGERKVFFDGRSDFYGLDFVRQYGRLIQVRPGWREYWESFHFTHALLPNDYPLLSALELIGWHPVYRDGAATLLAKGGT